ncbi:hypothetical protein NDU88_003678 [Pleurodeles waltl]|uniref:Uncharacterized protein n=1 Tax=Pleurodeles waltl TaxID=8319 RepID=A0AAV7MV99_PLEWA|nr:hypothetical protein NDU88_003678 [Pleurodeles waltl]
MTDPHAPRKLRNLQTKYRAFAHHEVKTMDLALRHRLYKTGGRAGKLLAWLGCRKKEMRWLHSIVGDNGVRYNTELEIANVFANYYEPLYHTHTTAEPSFIESYQAQIPLPRLTVEDRNSLDQDIDLTEIKAAF